MSGPKPQKMAQDSLAAQLYALSGGEQDLARQLEGLQGSAAPSRHLAEDLQQLLEATRATMQLVKVDRPPPSHDSCLYGRLLLGWDAS